MLCLPVAQVYVVLQRLLILGGADLRVFELGEIVQRLRLPDKLLFVPAFQLRLQQPPICGTVLGVLAQKHLIILLRRGKKPLFQAQVRHLF